MKALKNGQTATITADIGDGANVGVSFVCSNSTLATVSAQGLVTMTGTPSEPTEFSVVVKQSSTGVTLGLAKFVAIPAEVPDARVELMNRVFNPSLGVPEGGSLSLSKVFSQAYNEYVLQVDFASPVDDLTGIVGLTLDVRSDDNQIIKANAINARRLPSPRVFNAINWDKSYTATLVATTGDGFTKTITATYSEGVGGWNVGGWNTRGYGL